VPNDDANGRLFGEQHCFEGFLVFLATVVVDGEVGDSQDALKVDRLFLAGGDVQFASWTANSPSVCPGNLFHFTRGCQLVGTHCHSLGPEQTPNRSSNQVRQDLFAYLVKIQSHRFRDPMHRNSFHIILKSTHSYAPGLFHCYDVPDLLRTNYDRESDFRALGHRLLYTTGQKGLKLRIIQRHGARELLPHPDTLYETTASTRFLS
jgi:hypothetical protein